jgi:hypothetical protein
MVSFLLSVLSGLITGSGKRWISAAEAFEAPPANPAAQRYRAVAFYCFMAFSALLLTAALVDTLAKARPVSEVFGWSGIACFQVCVFCGIRYAIVNKAYEDDDWGRA